MQFKHYISIINSLIFLTFFAVAGNTSAGTIVSCGQLICSSSFSVFFNGSANEVGGGNILYNSETGDITLDLNNIRGNANIVNDGIMWTMGDGSIARVSSVFGNADPILGFGLGASTQGTGRTFSFAFDLPIALSGPIQATSSVSYSLTSQTSAGAQIAPLLGGNVVIAQDVDTSIGGRAPLDKGVNVGDTFFFTGGPETQNSPVYTGSNIINGDLDYDLMSVLVSFSLSANSAVGISGFVEQEEIPEVPLPAALPLLLSGLLGLSLVSRHRRKSS